MAYIECNSGKKPFEFTDVSNAITGNGVADKDYDQMIIIATWPNNTTRQFTHNGHTYTSIVKLYVTGTYWEIFLIPNVKQGDILYAPSSSYVWSHLK